jgi:hypothetical protein
MHGKSSNLQYNSLKYNTAPNSVGKQKVAASSCFTCAMHLRVWIASFFPQVGYSVKPDVVVEDGIIFCPNSAGLSGDLKC